MSGFKPTDGMVAAAKRALAWRRKYGRGGTSVGIARARDISNRKSLSLSTVKRMHSFFSRHEKNKSAPGFYMGSKGYPSNGRIAWDLWGGDAGQSWAANISKSHEKESAVDVVDEGKNDVFNMPFEQAFPAGESLSKPIQFDRNAPARRRQGARHAQIDPPNTVKEERKPNKTGAIDYRSAVCVRIPPEAKSQLEAIYGPGCIASADISLVTVDGDAYEVASALEGYFGKRPTFTMSSPMPLAEGAFYDMGGVDKIIETIFDGVEDARLNGIRDDKIGVMLEVPQNVELIPIDVKWSPDVILVVDDENELEVDFDEPSSEKKEKEAGGPWNLAELAEPGVTSNTMEDLNNRYTNPNVFEDPRGRIAKSRTAQVEWDTVPTDPKEKALYDERVKMRDHYKSLAKDARPPAELDPADVGVVSHGPVPEHQLVEMDRLLEVFPGRGTPLDVSSDALLRVNDSDELREGRRFYTLPRPVSRYGDYVYYQPGPKDYAVISKSGLMYYIHAMSTSVGPYITVSYDQVPRGFTNTDIQLYDVLQGQRPRFGINIKDSTDPFIELIIDQLLESGEVLRNDSEAWIMKDGRWVPRDSIGDVSGVKVHRDVLLATKLASQQSDLRVGLSHNGHKTVAIVNSLGNYYIYNLSTPGYKLEIAPGGAIEFLSGPDTSMFLPWFEDLDAMTPINDNEKRLSDHLFDLVKGRAKSGDVEPPYSQGEGPMGTRFDDDITEVKLFKAGQSFGRATRPLVAKIIKRDDKWLVTTESGRVLGKHDTKAKAQAQLAAVEISKHNKGSASDEQLEKDAVGLIEGPAVDEDGYGPGTAGRQDMAIPRPRGLDKFIHRK